MSLVSTYVRSQEGCWYENPVIRSSDWFICYDDNDPIELVIKKSYPNTVNDILKLLSQQGWVLQILSKGLQGQRLFNEEFLHARSYFLKQVSGAPSNQMLLGNIKLDSKPTREGVYYG